MLRGRSEHSCVLRSLPRDDHQGSGYIVKLSSQPDCSFVPLPLFPVRYKSLMIITGRFRTDIQLMVFGLIISGSWIISSGFFCDHTKYNEKFDTELDDKKYLYFDGYFYTIFMGLSVYPPKNYNILAEYFFQRFVNNYFRQTVFVTGAE